jgi:hypothetical protein
LASVVVKNGSILKTIQPIRNASHISGNCVILELCKSGLKVNVGPVTIDKATNGRILGRKGISINAFLKAVDDRSHHIHFGCAIALNTDILPT